MSQEQLRKGNEPRGGVVFRADQGSRSSTAAGKGIFADAVRSVDPSVAAGIEAAKNWRKAYMPQVAAVVAAGVGHGKDALRIAADGLESVRRNLAFVRNGDEVALDEALTRFDRATLETAVVEGRGDHPGRFEVPYKGRRLSGDDLLRQLDDWERRGVLEPSCRQALASVIDHPEWLRLEGRPFALIGAASEMGPMEPLSSWGAHIVAVDLPRPRLWNDLLDVTRRGSGRISVPIRGQGADVSSQAGADLLVNLPEIRTWLAGFEGPITLGNYVYADGSTFVRLAAATDALIANLIADRTELSIAYLATPTDVFAVGSDIVDATRARRSRLGSILGPVTGSKLYAPNYTQTLEGEGGRRWGLSDSLVPIQGPNYALAKSLQRWRAILAREEGTLSSANVAPASHTRSVVKNKMLAAAYRGAPSFGIEIFPSETTRWLMAALLVHDLNDPKAAARPETELAHPYDLLCDAALHGGIWRLGYEPRSILPLGLVIGSVKRT